jgi:hypothetical protein
MMRGSVEKSLREAGSKLFKTANSVSQFVSGTGQPHGIHSTPSRKRNTCLDRIVAIKISKNQFQVPLRSGG